MTTEEDYYELGECCATCTEWKRDEGSVYGQCGILHILTEEDFECSKWEDKCPPAPKLGDSKLERNLAENPNWMKN